MSAGMNRVEQIAGRSTRIRMWGRGRGRRGAHDKGWSRTPAKVDGLCDRGWRHEEGSVWVLPVLLYGRPIAASYLRHPRPSINLRERTTYVPDLVCPPTSVITFASVTTLRRYLCRGTCARTFVRARNSLVAAAALFIDSPPISWFVGNTIWSRGRCHLRNCMATSVIIFIGVRDVFVTNSKRRLD